MGHSVTFQCTDTEYNAQVRGIGTFSPSNDYQLSASVLKMRRKKRRGVAVILLLLIPFSFPCTTTQSYLL
jgi:hypothetical protein